MIDILKKTLFSTRLMAVLFLVSIAPSAWAEENPNTTVRMVKAMIPGAKWLDENDNASRPEAVKILARPN